MCERDSGHTSGSGKAKERVAVLEVARGATATVVYGRQPAKGIPHFLTAKNSFSEAAVPTQKR